MFGAEHGSAQKLLGETEELYTTIYKTAYSQPSQPFLCETSVLFRSQFILMHLRGHFASRSLILVRKINAFFTMRGRYGWVGLATFLSCKDSYGQTVILFVGATCAFYAPATTR